MLIEFIVCVLVGALCIVLGVLLWKKQMISLLHDYHYQHVSKSDVPAYTRLMGIGLTLIGIGTLLTGIINYAFETQSGWIAFCVGFVSGIIFMHKAQVKYNGSWIS